MKPDAYLKLYPGDWLRDTMQLDATSTGAYFLLILAHRGKLGIQSDDQTLRTIARVRESDWARVKAQIEHYFHIENGLWINNRSVEDWNRDCAEYKAACARTNAATLARKHNVTSNVTKIVTTHQSESESESVHSSERVKGAESNIPTITEVKAYASMHGVKPETAESLFDYYHGNNLWQNKHGKLINWKHKLISWATINRGQQNGKAYSSNSRNHTENSRNAGTSKPVTSVAEVVRRRQAQTMARQVAETANNSQLPLGGT